MSSSLLQGLVVVEVVEVVEVVDVADGFRCAERGGLLVVRPQTDSGFLATAGCFVVAYCTRTLDFDSY